MPVKALNQFNKDWCIKVRVLKKNPLRTYKNARGEGCILSFDLIDREGTMIQATCFNDKAKELDDKVQQEKVYTISGGMVKIANKKFTSIKNDYCLTLDRLAVVTEVKDTE